MQTSRVPEKSRLLTLLVAPRYRLIRHILLFTGISTIALNQPLFIFRQTGPLLGNMIYLITIFTLLSYLAVSYFHIYFLVPRFLLEKKYTAYLLVSSLAVLAAILLRLFQEYAIYHYLDIPHIRHSYINLVALLDILSDFLLNMICMAGISVTVVLKYWMGEYQRVNLLEKKKIRTELEQLKEQVNPAFLFHVLNRTGNLAKEDPTKASDMLMKLSLLLRYQLYDCSRDKVLLKSEINFITNYLSLEKLCRENLNFTLSVKGEPYHLLVAPLVFMPFVNLLVKQLYKKSSSALLYISFSVTNRQLCFLCEAGTPGLLQQSDLKEAEQRIRLLYPERYILTFTNDQKIKCSSIRLIIELP